MNKNNSNKNPIKNSNKNKNNVNKYVDPKKLNFSMDLGDRKILQVGCGGVGSAMPYMYVRHFNFKPGNVIIVDKDKSRIEKLAFKFPTIKFVHQEVTKNNYKDIIEKNLKKGDVFVDLAVKRAYFKSEQNVNIILY